MQTKKILYGSVSEDLQFLDCDNVNFTNIKVIVVPESVKKEFIEMMKKDVKSSPTQLKPCHTTQMLWLLFVLRMTTQCTRKRTHTQWVSQSLLIKK